MSEWMLAIGLALAGFLASNLDNLVLMVLLRATGAGAARIVAGFMLVLVLVTAAAMGGGWLLAGLSPRATGWLGLVPFCLGMAAFLRMWFGGEDERDAVTAADTAPGFAGIAALMLATSGDSVALFTATYADTDIAYWIPMALAVLVAGASWCGLAVGLGARIGHGNWLVRYGGVVMPLMMIGIGVYILLDTPTDLL